MMRAGKDYITKGSSKSRHRIVRAKRRELGATEKERLTTSPNKSKPTLKLR